MFAEAEIFLKLGTGAGLAYIVRKNFFVATARLPQQSIVDGGEL